MTVPIFLVVAAACISTVSLSCTPKQKPVPEPGSRQSRIAAEGKTARLLVRDVPADVEVVATEQERQVGLMYRRSLAPDSGMLFVFERPETLCFWMQNTWIPLSIAFIDSNGVITDIIEMTPEDTTTRYASSRPAQFALEMNAGWFQRHSVRPGDSVSGIP